MLQTFRFVVICTEQMTVRQKRTSILSIFYEGNCCIFLKNMIK